jgi:predicted RNase H-like HicB family nuclease
VSSSEFPIVQFTGVKPRNRQRAGASRDPAERDAVQDPSAESPAEASYPVTLVREESDEGAWLASVDALPGCVARGATPDEAVERASIAVAEWTAAARREGKDVPEPKSLQSHSGRLLLRMPQTLHAELSRVAERENVSLNQFITDVLAGALGWRAPARKTPATRAVPAVQEDAHAPDATRETAPAGTLKRRRFLNAVFVANGVIVALAAVIAVVVLIVALR